MIELLSPVGDFDCLKAAVQNGANAVYFGSESFSARAFAANFGLDELKKAINYAKIRGVSTHLTLNTLIKNDEFEDSFNLAKKAYEFGINAVIIQDLGLATAVINAFPDLEVHASTQMSVHNLQGVLKLQELGFKRAVLSRELSCQEIEYICKNSDIEIECFIHGALCISYSGQCLYSSMIGGRSGNRGRCAQPCRLPYTLFENDYSIDTGYLLSPRDLCGLDYIPNLVKAGVSSLKIEGRMKSPEYVATVTRIYRKYIDLAQSDKKYIIDENDKKDLLQVFNRGLSSSGHLDNEANRDLVYPEKPNNMGLFLGIIQKYNKNKYITVKLKEPLSIGDTISLENETGTYNISELMINDKNVKSANIGDTVVIGRMKGKINLGNKIYKMSSKSLNQIADDSFKNEVRKIKLNCEITIKKFENIYIRVTSADESKLYKDLDITYYLDVMPVDAQNKPLTEDKVIEQISKTNQTPYEFENIKINLDESTFLPKLSSLNELRRNILEQVEEYALNKSLNMTDNTNIQKNNLTVLNLLKNSNKQKNTFKDYKISVLLNDLNVDFDYSALENIDNIYIPLKYFFNKKFENILKVLNSKFNMYIYLPTIIKSNYRNLMSENIGKDIEKYHICGFVLSNISNTLLLKDLISEDKFEFIANYTFNTFNNITVNEIKNLKLNRYTLSPELDKKAILSLCDSDILDNEMIVYGNTPLMNMNYCLLGKSNKCYPDCQAKCLNKNKYYLKDRLGMKFPIRPDNIQTVTTIYNCKTTSISPNEFDINVARIDILDESISEINEIVQIVKNGERLEGKDYTNGNLNREI